MVMDEAPQHMRRASSQLVQVTDSAGDAATSRLGQHTLERIGNTPLLRLERLTRELPGVELLGKAEWLNPGGSVKDRAASRIVAEARRQGKLGPGKILLDSTSGNTGIAYAMIGAAQNFPVTLCMPDNVSPERKRILHAYGASIPTMPTGRLTTMAQPTRSGNKQRDVSLTSSPCLAPAEPSWAQHAD